MSYLCGKRYEQEKGDRGAPKGNKNRSKQKAHDAPIESTAEKVGDEFGVDQATIKRDAAFARAVDQQHR